MIEYIIPIDENRLEKEDYEWLKENSHGRLVRCKECKYAFFKEDLVLKNHIFCTKPGTERGNAVKPNDWFCADGRLNDDT